MPIEGQYSLEEWREIANSASFQAVDDEQLMRLHRHWIWASYSKREFEEALLKEGWSDVDNWVARVPWAMFLWYGLLYAVIAGYSSRGIRYGGELARDVRSVREPLKDARNAAFHVERDVDYYDDRFTGIALQNAVQLTRVHEALGQLLLDELRCRRAEQHRK
jgi:hypothetical protein